MSMRPYGDLSSFLHRSGSIYHIQMDKQGRYIYANNLYQKIFFSTASYHNHLFESSIFPQDVESYRSSIAECIEQPGQTVCVDLRRTRTDGSFFWIRWEFSAITENEKLIGIQGLGTDASERKRAELEKKEVQAKLVRERFLLRTLIDHLPDYIYVKDMSSKYIITNRAHWQMLGASQEAETIGKTLLDFLDHESAILNQSKDESLIKNGQASHDQEEFLINRQGKKIWLLTTRMPLLTENGELIGLVGISHDITERKTLQEELAANNINRQRQVTEATILAQEKERAEIGRELHDNINQILTTTKMYLDMAYTEKDIAEELILKSHENISTTIEEIRSLSKSLVPPSLGDIGLREAVREMIENMKLSQKINIKLNTSGFAKLSIPSNVKLSVFRIVQEQLNNVLKHSKATEAEIRMALSGDNLMVTISDNGLGFDPKKRMKGIGLMNITSRAEVHNGDVDVISSPGNGCTLKISIPI